jgi:hypothetical protein
MIYVFVSCLSFTRLEYKYFLLLLTLGNEIVVTGTRFVHTSEGRFLVTRLVLCPRCVAASQGDTELVQHQRRGSDSWSESNIPNGALGPKHVAEVKVLAINLSFTNFY